MPPQKGKQGTKGNKQILEENKQTVQFYVFMEIGATIFNVGCNVLFKWEDFTTARWFWLCFALAIYFGTVQFLMYMAKPKFAEDGKVTDGGLDLNMEAGIAEHIKDLIILTVICQVTSVFSTYFWVLWLLAPGRAFHILWTNILGPWFFQPAPEVDEKKQKKLEKRMSKRHHY